MARYTEQTVIDFSSSKPTCNILRSGTVEVEQWDGVTWISVETLEAGSDTYESGGLSLRFTPAAGVSFTITEV